MTIVLLALGFLIPGPAVFRAPTLDTAFSGTGGPTLAVQSMLDGEALRFAKALEEGDPRLLGEMMAEEGIRLHLPGEDHLLIQPRQARAALGEFLQRYGGGEAEVTRVSMAGGDQEKGFAEILWQTGSPGVSEPVIFTLFIAYSLVNESWLITEIRVLF